MRIHVYKRKIILTRYDLRYRHPTQNYTYFLLDAFIPWRSKRLNPYPNDSKSHCIKSPLAQSPNRSSESSQFSSDEIFPVAINQPFPRCRLLSQQQQPAKTENSPPKHTGPDRPTPALHGSRSLRPFFRADSIYVLSGGTASSLAPRFFARESSLVCKCLAAESPAPDQTNLFPPAAAAPGIA